MDKKKKAAEKEKLKTRQPMTGKESYGKRGTDRGKKFAERRHVNFTKDLIKVSGR